MKIYKMVTNNKCFNNIRNQKCWIAETYWHSTFTITPLFMWYLISPYLPVLGEDKRRKSPFLGLMGLKCSFSLAKLQTFRTRFNKSGLCNAHSELSSSYRLRRKQILNDGMRDIVKESKKDHQLHSLGYSKVTQWRQWTCMKFLSDTSWCIESKESNMFALKVQLDLIHLIFFTSMNNELEGTKQ